MVSAQTDCLASPKETRNIKHERIKQKMQNNLNKAKCRGGCTSVWRRLIVFHSDTEFGHNKDLTNTAVDM